MLNTKIQKTESEVPMQSGKKVNTVLMSMSIVLITVLTITIGAARIRSVSNANTKIIAPVNHNSGGASQIIGYKKYNGEWIRVVQLPEVTIVEPALKKSK